MFDPEIEKTARRNKKEARERHQIATSETNKDMAEVNFGNNQNENVRNPNNQQNAADNGELTLGELALPDIDYRPSCIILPDLDVNFDLKLSSWVYYLNFMGFLGKILIIS